MNRIDRLFGILLLLQRRRRVRAEDLARAYEVSERTIYRDMLALNQTGVRIISLPGVGYELAEGYYLPPLLFSPDEAAALFLSARMLKAHATGRLAEAAERALTKIAVVLPGDRRQAAEHMAATIDSVMPPTRFDLDDPLLTIFQQAIRERRVVRLLYHGHNRDQTTDREIEPHYLTYSNGAWYVNGYCRLRYFCFVAPFDDRVMLGFEWGVLMAESPLLEGNGKQMRYVTLRQQADLRPAELSALVAESAMVTASRARS